MTKPDLPEWVCVYCGDKYGSCPKGHIATWHQGTCGICGKTKFVTDPRDFSYLPRWEGQKNGR
jgi:hypothetical protein